MKTAAGCTRAHARMCDASVARIIKREQVMMTSYTYSVVYTPAVNSNQLRPAVDAFFEHVKVNDDDAKVRENRLKLLNEIRAATRAVADFSRIQD